MIAVISIIIADDQMLVREGLGTIINLEPDMRVTGLASNGLEACEMVERLNPDVVLMDIQMPEMDGIAALKQIKQNQPNIFVLVLSTFMEDQYIVEGLANGASGYLLKDMDTGKMIQAIRDAVNGQYMMHHEIAARLAFQITQLSKAKTSGSGMASAYDLTDREKEISALLIRGWSNRQIAAELFIAEGTVRNYISNLYAKLGVNDRVQAVVKLQRLLS
ncbi:response regulator [Paenibacillus sp. CAU 1782]